MSVPVHSGLHEAADAYDAFIVDLWGTLHDGIAPLPGAVDCLAELKRAGKAVALLSNAPFRIDAVLAVLERIGIPDDIYDEVLSSGEIAWRAIRDRADPWHAALGPAAAFIGPDRHRGMLDNPAIEREVPVAEADFVLCTGPFQAGDTVGDYDELLSQAAALSLPMVCANPDREVMRGADREICAGAIAERYAAEYGGNVAWHGKPFAGTFEEAMALLGAPAPHRTLMIGDGLGTDITGAVNARIGSAFIVSGIHGERLGVAFGQMPDPDRLDDLLSETGLTPDFALPGLVW